MSENTPAFVSVKLPAALVDQARQAAQTMRRSVASQVEYWATLGRALEHAGLTTADSHALIARQDRAHYAVAAAPPPPDALPPELEDLQAHVLALAKSGALSDRAQATVERNKAKAGKGSRTRKAA